jgi:magnesium transporter
MGAGEKMANPLFGPEIRWMLAEENLAGLKAFCESVHPSTVAETLTEDEFTVEQVWKVLGQSSIREQAVIFEYFPTPWQLKLVEGTGRPQMAKLIEQMSHDDRVDLLRRLSPPVAEGLLRLVDEADRRDIATLFRYGENTVGSIMTTDYAWLPATLTAGQAIDRLRQQAPDRETIYYVYILDESTRKLLGVISLRDLILTDRLTLLRELMEKDVTALKVGDDQEKAAKELARFDFLAMPVVDDENRLVGIITHDDVIDVITREATEDLQRQAGVGNIDENYLEAGFFTIWRKRSVWLACLFVAELLTFTAMSQFEDALAAILVLSLFIPLCISTGGNSGSQAATLITRSLALGHITYRDWGRVFRHELAMGIVLGLTLGVIALFRGIITSEELRSDIRERPESFDVLIDQELLPQPDGTYVLPTGTVMTSQSPTKRMTQITLPADGKVVEVPSSDESTRCYRFPAQSTTRVETVSRWRLAIVIAQAVGAICMWGTMIGAMFPLLLKRVGIDPAMASSPFVATFVDVTGIVIYFSIARVYLL